MRDWIAIFTALNIGEPIAYSQAISESRDNHVLALIEMTMFPFTDTDIRCVSFKWNDTFCCLMEWYSFVISVVPVWAGRFLADARLRFPRGTHATVTQQTPPLIFFLFSRVSRVISYCAAVYVDFFSVNSAFVHCSRTHKFHFSVTFSLKWIPRYYSHI